MFSEIKFPIKIAWVGDPHLSDTAPRSRQDNYFQNILDKLEWAVENHDLVIILGDLFSNKNISIRNLIRFIRILHKNKSWNKVCSIIGNHDIYNYNPDTLDRTTLGLLARLRYIKLIKDRIRIGKDIIVDVIPLAGRDLNLPSPIEAEGKTTILLGHCYYESNLDPAFSLTMEQVKELNYDYVILGHDHNPYKPVRVDKSLVLRVPSLSRGTSHEFNLTRQPNILVSSISETGALVNEYVEVPALTPEQVFKREVLAKPVVANNVAFVSNITKLLHDFETIALQVKKKSLKKILKRLEAPDFVISYLQDVHARNFVDF